MKARHTALLSVTILALGFAASQASADEVDPVRRMTVTYNDLDLSRAEDASVMYRRLVHAARNVCKKADGGFGDPGVYLRCTHDALIDATRDLHNPAVTALYDRKHGQRVATAPVLATSTG